MATNSDGALASHAVKPRSRHDGIDRNFCHFEMVAVAVAEETTMRATFSAVLVTASLMAAVALTSAQSIIGGGMRQPSQSKGLRGPAFAV